MLYGICLVVWVSAARVVAGTLAPRTVLLDRCFAVSVWLHCAGVMEYTPHCRRVVVSLDKKTVERVTEVAATRVTAHSGHARTTDRTDSKDSDMLGHATTCAA